MITKYVATVCLLLMFLTFIAITTEMSKYSYKLITVLIAGVMFIFLIGVVWR